ncbi:hypothetical protein CPB83DRAFT_888966 [Crepidotus variabilis]|uniref:Peptide hydrolase n=1 Tax=Crepidotus variabilis TaxID=179855 RepID=A0A9P6EU17_9AGAR|nr:hypothetical protein CPB83DRAFT_888966 [Crepidotus variabilis]
MAIKAASVLGYRVLPTSIVALVTYLALFISLIVTDSLPSVPEAGKQAGLNAKQAYEDLRHITAHPHPYNSHANDRVRKHILERLQGIAHQYPHVEVDDDLRSNGSWAGTYGVYFEGTNILVKINGTQNLTRGGVLFSAHYDSVSTAPGATDDGMGVATAMQLVQFFAENRTPRTAVFNINNGEEDWLNGAHAFLQHPWSNLTNTFLNLEGAAAGGRPILFRATSTSSVRAFRNTKRVPHPHANVLSSDAFARGFIRSGTDYSVYTSPGPHRGMNGLDLAFYKGRSKYHTKYDAIPYTIGGEKSLWSMMEVARGVGINLLNVPLDEDREDVPNETVDFRTENGDAPVYLDLFKAILLVFPISRLLIFNILALIIGPVILIVALACEKLYVGTRERQHAIAQDDPHPTVGPPARHPTPPLLQHESHSTVQETPHLRYVHRLPVPGDLDSDEHVSELADDERIGGTHQKEGRAAHWAHTLWMHLKFWVALFVVSGLLLLLMWGYVVINPFAMYSSPYTVLFSFASLAYLVLTVVLTFPSSVPFYHPKFKLLLFTDAVPPPAQQQKLVIFIHLYIFTWALLVVSTFGITKLKPGVGSGYLISVWNVSAGVGCFLAVIEAIILTSLWKPSASSAAGGPSYEELPGEDSSRHLPRRQNSFQDTERHLEDLDERTPLIYRNHQSHEDGTLHPSRGHIAADKEEGGSVGTLATWWWIPQFLLSVPIPVMLFAHVTMVIVDGTAQTLSDGPSPWSVYSMVAIPAVLLVLPLAPFSYKLRPFRPLTLFIFIIFVLSTVYAFLLSPFNVEEPLKVYFQQTVQLDALSSSWSPPTGTTKVVTALIGPKRYLRPSLLPYLPSSQLDPNSINCGSDPLKIGLTRCEWSVGSKMAPSPGTLKSTQMTTTEEENTKWGDSEFLKATVKRTGPSTAQIRVRGRNTRSCRVYFDAQPVFKYNISESRKDGSLFAGSTMQKGYDVPSTGVKEVRLWSRTWEKEFVVDVGWGNKTDNSGLDVMEGRVACEWNEYESALVDSGPFGHKDVGGLRGDGVQDANRPKIPALEEVLASLPEWAVVSKATDGLVEAWAPFVI